MRAKTFFYVCGGALLLALSYHFGAESARAQSGLQIDGPAIALSQNPFTDPPRASGVVDRTFYDWFRGGTHVVSVPVPGTDKVIATDPNFQQVMLANGDLYQFGGSDWTYLGNLFDAGTVGTQRATWGRVKAHYR